MALNSIPEDWIKRHIDRWLEVASEIDPGPMRDAAMLRADHIMDMVKAWRESDEAKRGVE